MARNTGQRVITKLQLARSNSQVARGINIIIIITLATIITMIWQHADSLWRSLLCPRPNIIRGASQPTSVLWPLALLPVLPLLSLRRVLPRLVALLRSADKLSMASGTPRKNSCSFTRGEIPRTTGTELNGKLSRLVLLSLAHQNGRNVALLGEMRPREFLEYWVLRLMLLSPLRHLRHLVHLSLGHCHPMVSNMLWLCHPGRIQSSCRQPFPNRKPC